MRSALQIVCCILLLFPMMAIGAQAAPTSQTPPSKLSALKEGIKHIALAQEAERKQPDAEKDDYYASRALAAQEAMAAWVTPTFFVSLTGVIVSVIGLFAILYSLHLNRRATNAAQDAVLVARDANAAQSRAWVSLTCNINSLKRGRTHAGINGLYFNVSCTAKNHGNSPATSVIFHAEIALLSPQISSRFDRMSEYSNGIRARADHDAEAIFPGVAIQVNHQVFLPDADIEASMLGKDFKMIQPIIYGCLNYKSPHVEGIRQTRFSYDVCSINEDGSVEVLMPDRPDWLDKRIGLVGPGIIVAD